MKKTLFVTALLSAATLLNAAPAAKTAAKVAAKPSPTALAAAKAGFNAAIWKNAEFNLTRKAGKTSWKVAADKAPLGWELAETKGNKEFTLFPQGNSGDFFARIKKGRIAQDIRKTGENNIFHFRYKGKGNAYMYVIRYNKKTGSNLPSKLFKHLQNVDVKEWKDEVMEVKIPVHKDGERRCFWFWAYDGEFDVDSIYLTVK